VPTVSAGLVVWRRGPDGAPEVLAGHMGGPFWSRKDDAAWSIPKGEVDPGEDPLAAARREFGEELGLPVPAGEPRELGTVRGRDKLLHAWAIEADVDLEGFRPCTFELEWPPRSGRRQAFPELDRVAFLGPDEARRRLVAYQVPLLDRL
jgi:predicted NUDIX family NTP pyrophosphohydrolase